MREQAPRVHALRDATHEILFGGYSTDDHTMEQIRRMDSLLVFCCAHSCELSQEHEDMVSGLLWKVALNQDSK